MSTRGKRQLIAFCYHVSIVVISLAGAKLSMIIKSDALLQISSCFLLVHLITFRVIPISRFIQEKLIPEATCLACGAVIDLVGLHRCGCGYVSFRERHVFSPCPMCQKHFMWVVCPECEVSVPV